MATTIETGFDLKAIREELDASDWERNYEGDGQVRSVFLSTVFALTPSGKFYTPWANSNVDGCPRCGGSGSRKPPRTGKRKRARAKRRLHDFSRGTIKRGTALSPEGRAYADRVRPFRDKAFRATDTTCDYCGGCGSREAHLDELWREKAEAELESIGASLASGEGDPCDLFAEEYRDAPEEDEEGPYECAECGMDDHPTSECPNKESLDGGTPREGEV